MNCLRNQNGIALIVTLLALALITAMVVEFAYGVYTGTNNLYNWRDSQRLSLMARSGVNVSAKYVPDVVEKIKLTEPMELPVENPFEDFQGMITVRIEDENGKFPINAIVPDNQNVDKIDIHSPYNVFIRLLRELSLDEKIADRVIDWIDKNSIAEVDNSEENAKNDELSSVDELLLIKGISKEDYKKLFPYITVYGTRTLPQININSAEKPVLKALFSGTTDDLVNRIITLRKSDAFIDRGNLISRIGNIDIPSMVTFKSNVFFISSRASSGGVKRIIETVFNTNSKKIEYWKEY
jgi:general secretion pathway protein K